MSIRRRESKKYGDTYQVYFPYEQEGVRAVYRKGGFLTEQAAAAHETLVRLRLSGCGVVAVGERTLNEEYLAWARGGTQDYQHSTVETMKGHYLCHVWDDALGHTPLGGINCAVLRDFFNRNAGNSIASNRQIKKVLTAVLNYAEMNEDIDRNPIHLIKIKGQDTCAGEPVPPTEQEIDMLVAAFAARRSFTGKAFAVAIRISQYTGLRISETLALEKRDFDFARSTLTVRRKLVYHGLRKSELYTSDTLKSSASRAVLPLAEGLKTILAEWFEQNPHPVVVCDRDGGYIHPTTFGNEIRKECKPLGISFHFHLLRHSLACRLYQKGVDVKVAQELMRHANYQTTMNIYTHLGKEDKKKVIDYVFAPDDAAQEVPKSCRKVPKTDWQPW